VIHLTCDIKSEPQVDADAGEVGWVIAVRMP
jgi:hypothetical protein